MGRRGGGVDIEEEGGKGWKEVNEMTSQGCIWDMRTVMNRFISEGGLFLNRIGQIVGLRTYDACIIRSIRDNQSRAALANILSYHTSGPLRVLFMFDLTPRQKDVQTCMIDRVRYQSYFTYDV